MSGRAVAVVVHPSALRPSWHIAFLVAAAEVAKHVTLTLAVLAGGAAIATLVLVLLVVSAPLGAALLAWVLWRASRDGASGAKRSLARARRRARSLGLHVVRS